MKRVLGQFLGAMAIAGALSLPAIAASPFDKFIFEFEGGPLLVLQNDGRYGAGGTFYRASTVGQSENLLVARRYSGEATFAQRHTVVLLYAPFDVTTRATLNEPLVFNDATFPAGTVIDSRYLFDGLRASYLYRVWENSRFAADLGGTLQIRNANVGMTNLTGTLYANESDIGLVPALKVRLRYTTEGGTYAMWEADGLSSFGLGSVGGGILDTALTLGLPLQPGLDLTLKARYLGGGADVKKRDLFNWAHFVSLGAGFRWDVVNFWPQKTTAAADVPQTGSAEKSGVTSDADR